MIVTDGFSLTLLDANGTLIDTIGNLNGGGGTAWEIPKRLLNVRVSFIRRFDEDTPRLGTERKGWIPADKVKNPSEGIYYGHLSDIGTPVVIVAKIPHYLLIYQHSQRMLFQGISLSNGLRNRS